MDLTLVCDRHLLIVLFILLPIGTSKIHYCHFRPTDRFLDCRSRRLTRVPVDDFNFNDAAGIDLSFNNISVIKNRTFSNVTGLQILDLSNNAIATLEHEAFYGLAELLSLNLSVNPFTLSPDVVPAELFEPLVSLRTIGMQRYKMPGYLEWRGIDRAFGHLKNLTKLEMNFPLDFTFGPGFGQLTKLKSIHAFGRPRLNTDCYFGTLRNTTFEVFRNISLKEIHLYHCNIQTIQSNAFEPLGALTVLDLTYNSDLGLRPALKSLYGLRGKNMTEIKLVHLNNATCGSTDSYVLTKPDFVYVKTICVKSIDVSQNYLSLVDNSLAPKFRLDCLEKLNASFHSLRCAPFGFLLSLVAAKQLRNVDFSQGFGPPSYDAYLSPTSNFYNNANCTAHDVTLYPFPLPPNLVVLNVSGIMAWFHIDSDVRLANGLNLRIVRAAYNRLDNCDGSTVLGAEDLTHLDISGIVCDVFKSNYFQHFRKLVSLSLSNCPKMDVALMAPTDPFAILDALEEMDISGNKLTDLQPQLFRNNKNLRTINLSNNKLQHLPKTLFSIPNLKQLDLSYNVFSDLLPDEINLMEGWITRKRNSKLFQLILGNNPLQCTCSTVLSIRWILQRRQYLDKEGNYTCVQSDGTRISLYKFGETLSNFEVKCVSQTYLIISVVGILTLLVLILFFAAVYRYRVNLRYWLYTKLKPPQNMFLNHDYIYDAFVAYTSGDYEWIFRVLRKNLEMVENPVKLCLHERDFIPGRPIHENIVDKIRESKKIILIISMAFLDSTYGPLEIEYAGMKCLEEGRDDIILCVLFEDIPVREMPRALRNLWHKITFLKWSSDPEEQVVFWDRLRNAIQ